MKVYLDDERQTPSGWVRTYTAPETIDLLKSEEVTHLSLDHDLGDENDPSVGNGYDVLLWLEEMVGLFGFKPPEYMDVHSSNASARIKMEAAIRKIRRLAE